MKRAIPTTYTKHLDERSDGQTLGQGAAISWRGFWTGAFLSFFLAIGAPYANTAMHATFMAWDFNTPGAIFLFLVLIGLLNALFKAASRSRATAIGLAVAAPVLFVTYYGLNEVDTLRPGLWLASFLLASALLNVPLAFRGMTLALNRADLVLVYVMLLVVSALCTMGMSQQLLPIISALAYYATPENKWAEKLVPLMPDRRILVDDGADNQSFYEGLGPHASVPWEAWMEPLFWWSILLMSLYVAMISAAVILRRQWMERERLAYPLTQVGWPWCAVRERKDW